MKPIEDRYTDPHGRRAGARYAVEVPVQVSYDAGRGRVASLSGVIQDISISGARIGKIEKGIPAGRLVKLRFQFFATSTPVTLGARMVRETDDGFAVEFSRVNQFMRNAIKVAISRLRQRNEEEATEDTSQSLLGN